MSQFEELCVTPFSLSTTRVQLFMKFSLLVRHFASEGMSMDIWIDGSYLTKKINPDDIDVVMKIREEVYSTWTAGQKGAIEWIVSKENEDEVHGIFGAHCFLIKSESHICPRDHYWRSDAFGRALISRERKGIVRIVIPDGNALRTISHNRGIINGPCGVVGLSES